MVTILMIFQGVVSVLLIAVVLLQFGKGAEAGLFTGGGVDSVFTGAQKGNIFTKITIILSILFMGNSIFLAKIQGEKASSSLLDEVAPVTVPLNLDPSPKAKKSSPPKKAAPAK